MSAGRGSRYSPIAFSCPAKSGNSPSCGRRPLGQQDVPGEHRAEVLAVQAHRTRGVTGRVDDLEPDIGDLEDAAVFHLDIGVLIGMGLPPQRAVRRVQGHRRLVRFGRVECGGDVAGVAVGADDREHLPVAHRVEQARGVGAGIDDDDLLVVADEPGVDGVPGPRARTRETGRSEYSPDLSYHSRRAGQARVIRPAVAPGRAGPGRPPRRWSRRRGGSPSGCRGRRCRPWAPGRDREPRR